MKKNCHSLPGWKDVALQEGMFCYLQNRPLFTHHKLSWVVSDKVSERCLKNFWFWTATRSLWEGNIYRYPSAHPLAHTHTCTCEWDKGYTYIRILLSPSDCKESFNSCYIMVYLPWVFQNGSIITSHVCILLNYLSLFPGGERQGGRQLIQCKWKAFEAPYGEDVITVRRLIT